MFSVVVPVYNVEKYLASCLDSILNQSYTDFEILLIDDGSTDKSGIICDEYACKDDRINVFHIENGGVSNARNIGIESSKGDWITFIDSDDILPDGTFENWHKIILKENVRLIIASIRFDLNIDGTDFTIHGFPDKVKVIEAEPSEDFRIKLLDCLGLSFWGKIYHKSLIDGIRFPRGISNYEDVIALWQVAKKNPTYALTEHVGYEARFRPGSASRNHGGIQPFQNRINSLVYACGVMRDLFHGDNHTLISLSRFIIIEGLGNRTLYRGFAKDDGKLVVEMSNKLFQAMSVSCVIPLIMKLLILIRLKTMKRFPNYYPKVIYYPIRAILRFMPK